MNAPGKGMLKVTSILLIIFGAIAVFFNLFTVACSAALTSVGSQLTEELGSVANDAVAAVSSWALILSIAALILGVAELVFGIMGVKKSADPAKAGFFVMAGIVMCALYLVDIVVSTILVSFPVLSVVGFVLPILYIVGGNMNKKAVAAPAA
jgi:hypothetical protein